MTTSMNTIVVLFLLLASSVTVVSGFVVVVVTTNSASSSCSTRRSSSSSCSTTAFLLSPPFQQQQQSAFSRASSSSSSSSSSSVCLQLAASSSDNAETQLQELFRQHCDKDGLLTKDELLKMEFISDLLSNNDLLEEELDDIWSAAIKKKSDGAIDVSSFVQIYQDIDDLFDDDSSDSSEDESSVVAINDNDDDDNEEQEFTTDTLVVADDEELKSVFYDTLCDENSSKLITKQTLREWSEVTKLLSEGLLGEDEFDDLWDKTANNNDTVMNVEQFLSFNAALDDLFVFDDDEEAALETTAISSSDMVTGEDLPPSVLFAALANPKNNLVGRKELEKWAELQQMLDDKELLPLELQNIYEEIPKAKNDMLDEAGFTALWESIDALFEDVQDDNDDERNKSQGSTKTAAPSATSNKENEAKTALLSLIEEINSDDERLPCGLESTEREERQVQQIVSALEESTPNIIRQKQGKIDLIDLAGEWELLYSSSSAMKFNKGLSGLGGSVPNGRFGGLVQTLKASKYLTDVEYLERIEVNPSSASFDVRVTGGWDLRTSVSLFTGAPSTVLTVEPDKVTYGPTSTRADHWKSLGPLNMLDVTYLDDDLRVMRGNTSTDTIFVFRRKS